MPLKRVDEVYRAVEDDCEGGDKTGSYVYGFIMWCGEGREVGGSGYERTYMNCFRKRCGSSCHCSWGNSLSARAQGYERHLYLWHEAQFLPCTERR